MKLRPCACTHDDAVQTHVNDTIACILLEHDCAKDSQARAHIHVGAWKTPSLPTAGQLLLAALYPRWSLPTVGNGGASEPS